MPVSIIKIFVFLFFLPSAIIMGQDQLHGAIVSSEFNLPTGIPLAGYGSEKRRLKPIDWKQEVPHSFFFKPSEGQLDPIRCKVFLLRKDGRNLLMINLDMIGVSYRFRKSITKKLSRYGFRDNEIIISATHTHSGPGTLSRKILLEAVAVDIFKKENYDLIVEQTYHSVLKAIENLAPVQLYHTIIETYGLQRNKWRKKNEAHYDNSAKILLMKSKDGNWLGGILSFAIHGGSLGPTNLQYSADVIGEIERSMEELIFSQNGAEGTWPTIAMFQGALGDVGVVERGLECMKDIGNSFSYQSRVYLDSLQPVAPEFKVVTKKIWLGLPGYSIKYSSDGKFWDMKWLPPLRMPLVGIMNQRATISAARIGDVIFLSWPGEPSTLLGFKTIQQAKEFGLENTWVISLSNDYMGYFTAKHEYFEGKYDSRSSLFNYRGAKRILKQQKKLMLQLIPGELDEPENDVISKIK